MRSGQNPSLTVDESGLDVAAKHIVEAAKVYRNSDLNKKISRDQRKVLFNV